MRSGFAPNGSGFASCRAVRGASPSSQTKETWNGISQLEFAHRLAEMDIDQTTAKLQSLRDSIAAGGLIANLTGSAAALKSGGALIAQRFSRLGAPKMGIGGAVSKSSELSRGEDYEKQPPFPMEEVFASPSLQIGFAAMTLKAAAFDTMEQVAETVLAHQLSTGALWETIRMKGGAYGASASSESLERCFSLFTYRDPAPLRSLESFSAILKGGFSVSDDDGFQENLVKTIIGCYARENRPRSPSDKGIADFLRYISLIEDDYRRRRVERLISVSAGDIATALDTLASQCEQVPASRVIITGIKDAEQAAKALGTEVQTLPV
jgi:Zn-dependent M16 (insulinase) family peptidase